jgi:hypothetical protein
VPELPFTESVVFPPAQIVAFEETINGLEAFEIVILF